MGRSVSTPRDAAWVIYLRPDIPDGDHFWWQDVMDSFREPFKSAHKGLSDCDDWLDREDHAILEDDQWRVFIGVSEYCGVVALWCVPQDIEPWEDDEDCPLRREAQLGQRDEYVESLRATALEFWGEEAYRKIGTMSNGEGVYGRH